MQNFIFLNSPDTRAGRILSKCTSCICKSLVWRFIMVSGLLVSLSLTGTQAIAQTYTIGTGTASNSSTTYPAPYGNYYFGARHQMLYRASELTTAGMTAGAVLQFGFNVTALNGTDPLEGFTIRMKNASNTALTTAWETGLTQVFGPVTYTPTTGWNLHTLNGTFVWDGTSNILVETCFNNSDYTSNVSTQWTTGLPAGTSLFYREDLSGICSGTGAQGTLSTNRPNARFVMGPVPTCTSPPTPGTVTGNLTICSGQTTSLTLSGHMAGTTIQWQSSPDGTTWTNISGATATSITTPALSASTYYRANVTCNTSTVATPSVQVTIMGSAITTFPHVQNFDGAICGWTVLDVNADTYTWGISSSFPSSAPNSLQYGYNPAAAADDWVFSPAIAMTAGNQYEISFKYRVRSGTYPEALEVKWGTTNTVAAMTNTIFSNNNLVNETYATATAIIAPTATGNVTIGFHAFSIANMWDIYVDDFTITEIPPCSGMPVAGTGPATITAICAGNSKELTVTGATQGPGISYQWEQATSAAGPWTNATGGTGATTTTFTSPALSATTFYRLQVTCANGNQMAATAPMEVVINNPLITASAGDTRCGTGPVTLSATPSAGATVNWYAAATGGVPLASGTTYSPNVSATTTFYATATSGGGTFNVGASTNTIGPGGATGTTLYYQIFDVLTPLTLDHVYVYPGSAGNVVLHLSNSAGTVLQTFTVPVTAADVNQKTQIPINYQLAPGTGYRLGWHTGSVNLFRNTTGAVYPYTVPGAISITGNSFDPAYWYYVYDFVVTTGCESARTAVVATVTPGPATPTITASGPISLCTGGSVVLTAASATSGVTFQWFESGTAIAGATSATYTANAAGSYTVVASDAGCNSNASAATAVTVNTQPAAPAIAAGGATTICAGGSVVLTASSATPGVTYQWSNNGTAIPGATAAAYTATTAGNYTVVASNGGCNSPASAATSVTVTPAPATPVITAGGATTFCSGGSVALTGASATAGVTYRWSRNGTPVAGATAATYTATQTGNYRVVATAGGCSDSSAVTAVTVNPKPATPSITLSGNTLTASATTGTYQWYSVSGTTMTPVPGATSATFNPTASGDYTVMVIVNGCESDAAASMNVVLGMSSLAPGLKLEVYPNPTQGRFSVELTGFEKEATIRILNVTGQVIATEKVAITGEVTAKTLDLGGMAKGVYILKVTSGDNLTFRKVILD